jgi:hypothetical protein
MSTDTGRRYRFPATDRTGLLLGLSAAQCAILAIGLLAAGLALPASPPAAIALLAAAGIFSFAGWGSEPAYRHAARRAAWTARTRTGRTRWADPAPWTASRIGRLHLPASFGTLHLWTAGTAAVIEDSRERTYTILLPVAGRSLALAEPADQDAVVTGWGSVLASLAGQRSIVRLAVSEWAGPAGTLTASPDTIRTGASDYEELLASASPAARVHRNLLALTCRPATPGRDRRDLAAVIEQARMLAGQLDQLGLAPGPPLTPGQLAGLLRSRLDPTQRTARSMRTATPVSQKAAWDHVQVDASMHATYWIAEWPKLPVPANWLEPLILDARASRTLTVLYQPVPAADAARRLRRDATRLAADRQQRQRSGWRIDAQQERTNDEVHQREAELAAGHAECDYLGLLTVTATTFDALTDACRDIEDTAARAGLDIRRLNGRHDHTLPAALGMLGRTVPASRWQ